MDFFDGEDSTAIWIFFLLATFITQITFLNMLIAVMGDTYAKVTETKDQNALVEKIRIIADYISVVDDKKKNDRYLIVTKPKDSDEGDEWEGTVSALRKSIDSAVAHMRGTFIKKFTVLSTEVSTFNGKLTAVNERLGGLQNLSQKQAITIGEIQNTLKKMIEAKTPKKQPVEGKKGRKRGSIMKESFGNLLKTKQ